MQQLRLLNMAIIVDNRNLFRKDRKLLLRKNVILLLKLPTAQQVILSPSQEQNNCVMKLKAEIGMTLTGMNIKLKI